MENVATMNAALGPNNSYYFPWSDTFSASAKLPETLQSLIDRHVQISSLALGPNGQYAVVYREGDIWVLGKVDSGLCLFRPCSGLHSTGGEKVPSRLHSWLSASEELPGQLSEGRNGPYIKMALGPDGSWLAFEGAFISFGTL